MPGSRSLLAATVLVAVVVAGASCSETAQPAPARLSPSPSAVPWTGKLSYEFSHEFWEGIDWEGLAIEFGATTIDRHAVVVPQPTRSWAVMVEAVAHADLARNSTGGDILVFVSEDVQHAYDTYQNILSAARPSGIEWGHAVEAWWAEGVLLDTYDPRRSRPRVHVRYLVYDQNLVLDLSWTGNVDPEEGREAAVGRFREMALALLTEAIRQIRCRPQVENVSTAHCQRVG